MPPRPGHGQRPVTCDQRRRWREPTLRLVRADIDRDLASNAMGPADPAHDDTDPHD